MVPVIYRFVFQIIRLDLCSPAHASSIRHTNTLLQADPRRPYTQYNTPIHTVHTPWSESFVQTQIFRDYYLLCSIGVIIAARIHIHSSLLFCRIFRHQPESALNRFGVHRKRHMSAEGHRFANIIYGTQTLASPRCRA